VTGRPRARRLPTACRAVGSKRLRWLEPASRSRRWRADEFKRYARRCGRDRGNTAIEIAILMPAIILLIFGSIQIALVFLARHTALAAAQEGVTAQRVYQAPSNAGKNKTNAFLSNHNEWITSTTVKVTTDPENVTVTVTGKAIELVPFINLHVSVTAHGSRERITAP
jgi:Flp pilus assembly protein TadG